ncbi:Pre-rRNA-processing protein ipi3 [Mycoemilia scoparia]|uniref:Pre-rRNA-processing protein ipi3 n=1 Tax=Mycoemilia scoparia TaxID=417184 RepID=A0A9W8A5T4_9FUNG|nr:Pre-rRNA-processing protein ipi3 [Mycoemilia scoparia]
MFSEAVIGSSSTEGSIVIHDIRTGVRLGTLTNTPVGYSHGFCTNASIESQTQVTPPWVLALSKGKPMWSVYPLAKGDRSTKMTFPCPEQLTCVEATPDGVYVAAGSASGKVYVWSTSDGVLQRSWEGHYGAVTCIRFVGNNAILTGGHDGAVNVWILSHVLDLTKINEVPIAMATLSDHTLPITDIWVSPSAAGYNAFSDRTLVYTSSKDCTCKAWSLNVYSPHISNAAAGGGGGVTMSERQEPLSSWLFPSPISSIVVDLPETRLFCASDRGEVYQVDLYQQRSNGMSDGQSQGLESVIGTRSVQSVGLDSKTKSGKAKTYIGHEGKVNSISLSMDGTLLVSGGEDGSIRVWDTTSRQCLRAVQQPSSSSSPSDSNTKGQGSRKVIPAATQVAKGVSKVLVVMMPPELGGAHSIFQRVTGGSNVSSNKDVEQITDGLKSGSTPRSLVANPVPFFSALRRIPRRQFDPTICPGENDLDTSKTVVLGDTRRSVNELLASLDDTLGGGNKDPYAPELNNALDQNTARIIANSFNGDKGSSLQQKIEELQSELDRLNDHQTRINKLNDELYQATVSNFMQNR